jgi:chaperone BCS1
MTDFSGAHKFGFNDSSRPTNPVTANVTATTTTATDNIAPKKATTPPNLAGLSSPSTLTNKNGNGHTATDLAHIAAQFAAEIPDGQFSPAMLQGFLLERKKKPHQALAEVEDWVKKTTVKKTSGGGKLAVR